GTASPPAISERRAEAAFDSGMAVVEQLRTGLRPSDIVTRKSLENAITVVMATGGSTNAVLHLLAIAHEAGVPLELADFDRVSERTPIIADLKPGGRFAAIDLGDAGGGQLAARRLPPAHPLAAEGAEAVETPGQAVVVAVDKPLKPTGGLVILRGSLAPD